MESISWERDRIAMRLGAVAGCPLAHWPGLQSMLANMEVLVPLLHGRLPILKNKSFDAADAES
ncbi:hypothetical protein J2S64_000825 [Paeniglutamicibacter sulfureus]|uniref:Uncharacterized protein n=1 Tax=Paeniglutamicibacter sulfureus TaxID=43666 RepID=A0ABU2BGP4_9MICC|nr:hypothetical protein [Paeniglutamicibacter sulfureus]